MIPQVTGINPGKSHGQGPWVSWSKHRLDDKLVGKQEDTFLLDILMMVVRLQGMARQERSRLGLHMVLDDFMRCPSPSLYTKPGSGESVYVYRYSFLTLTCSVRQVSAPSLRVEDFYVAAN